jgi:RNA polymerase sigma factor (TIGR02999 family)
MAAPSPASITGLLLSWQAGDQAALDVLVPIVHGELRRLAHRYMKRENPGHVLQTTALVNEAYLRLIDAGRVQWRDRVHFFAICARLMRQILVHYARTRDAKKRGGAIRHVSLDEAVVVAPEHDPDLVRLDDALAALEAFDARKAKVVELRFFAGLTLDETAEVLNVSADTVGRDWDLAKAWLYRQMVHGDQA